MILVDGPNGNLVIGSFNSQSFPKWNIFMQKYWNYTFGLAYFLLGDNGYMIFIQRENENFVE
jgi:hypothetical protein